MTWAVWGVCVLAVGVRVPALVHYWRNGKARRNPESGALSLEIAANCYGAVMWALTASATDGTDWPALVTMAIKAGVGLNLVIAIYTARRLYAVHDERRM